MREYSLYIEYKGKKYLLISAPLIDIDEITTSFVNKEKMLEVLFRDKTFDYSECSIIIESPNKHTVQFIGSDFRNVIKNFNDNGYMNTLCNISIDILSKYFNETLKEKIYSNSRDQFEVIEKKNEYMSNDKIPIVQIVKLLSRIEKAETAATRSEKNSSDILNSKTNLKYKVRKYNENYKDYRNMYCYMVGISLINQGELVYTEEERARLKQFLNKAKDKVDSLIYDNSQLSLPGLNLGPEIEEPVKEDEEVVLNYIEKKSNNDSSSKTKV